MKKIFALALAAVMTAGMTTVAFARNDVAISFFNANSDNYAIDANDDGYFMVSANHYSTDEYALDTAEGGKKVALFLYNRGNGQPIVDADDVDGAKVVADWDSGVVKPEKPTIERIKVKADDGSVTAQYAVVFTLPEAPETKSADLTGTVTVYKNTADKKLEANNFEVNLTYGDATWNLVDDGEDLATDVAIVNFKDFDDVAYLTFGNDFEFEVDVTGQGKLNLKNNTEFNKEFAAMYDYANIDFITFEKEPTFNKIGTAYIYADEDAYIYEVTEDGAKEIAGLTWDEDYEAWTFKTRTLGAYAISDVELDEKTVTEDKDDTTTDGGKENPDTGR